MDQPKIPGYLSAADVAERLGVRVTTIHRYHHRGDMPPEDARFGRSPAWKEATIEQWEKDRASASWNRKK
jgi:predicted DNA-binding transcriptional regulator AlpA